MADVKNELLDALRLRAESLLEDPGSVERTFRDAAAAGREANRDLKALTRIFVAKLLERFTELVKQDQEMALLVRVYRDLREQANAGRRAKTALAEMKGSETSDY